MKNSTLMVNLKIKYAGGIPNSNILRDSTYVNSENFKEFTVIGVYFPDPELTVKIKKGIYPRHSLLVHHHEQGSNMSSSFMYNQNDFLFKAKPKNGKISVLEVIQ